MSDTTEGPAPARPGQARPVYHLANRPGGAAFVMIIVT
jgi:hypothetical protein